MSNVTPQIPAGWYPAPGDPARVRWWDGAQWSDQHADRYTVAGPLRAPQGTQVYNVWIWLITLMPLLSLLTYFSYFSFDWSGLINLQNYDPTGTLGSELSLLSSPAYLISIVGGWLLYGLTVWFAYLDWKWLKAAGVPKPFHWAFGFLTVVYTIGRSVVARRRTGHGIAPMWVAIGIMVLSFVFSIALSVWLFVTIMGNIHTYAPTLGS